MPTKIKSLALILFTSLFFISVQASEFIPFANGTPQEILDSINSMVEKKTKDKAILSSIAGALSDEDMNIKIKERAAWALGQLNARPYVNALVKAAHHKGLLVRSAALEALIHMRAQSGLSAYIEIAKTDPVLSMRQRACVALGLLKWSKAIQPLVNLSRDPKEEIRGAATLAMAATHSKQNDFREVVTEMKSDSSPYVQDRADKALAIINQKNQSIQNQLKSEDADIRLFAALYFHHHGNKNDLEALQEQLTAETNDEVHFELSNAIESIKKSEAKKARQQKARKAKKLKAKGQNKPTSTQAR